jgi:hypothetical protein
MRPAIAAMAVVFVWGLVVCPMNAQKVPPKPPAQPKPAKPNNGKQQWGKVPQQPGLVEQLKAFQKLSPEQREKELAKLPPQRRERIENQMARLDRMAPEDRERALNKLETFEHLTPERRQAVNEEIESLRGLTRRQKGARLFSEEFSKEYTPEEQKVIRETFPVGREAPAGKDQ